MRDIGNAGSSNGAAQQNLKSYKSSMKPSQSFLINNIKTLISVLSPRCDTASMRSWMRLLPLASLTLSAPTHQTIPDWQVLSLNITEDSSSPLGVKGELHFSVYRSEVGTSVENCQYNWQSLNGTVPKELSRCGEGSDLSFRLEEYKQGFIDIYLSSGANMVENEVLTRSSQFNLSYSAEEPTSGHKKLSCINHHPSNTTQCVMVGPNADFNTPLFIPVSEAPVEVPVQLSTVALMTRDQDKEFWVDETPKPKPFRWQVLSLTVKELFNQTDVEGRFFGKPLVRGSLVFDLQRPDSPKHIDHCIVNWAVMGTHTPDRWMKCGEHNDLYFSIKHYSRIDHPYTLDIELNEVSQVVDGSWDGKFAEIKLRQLYQSPVTDLKILWCAEKIDLHTRECRMIDQTGDFNNPLSLHVKVSHNVVPKGPDHDGPWKD
ncbi:hypothetical protein EJ08DRAFT_468980 [Tothia fuscella]|uniref:Uncharacterized protein n=1 Tax=Tothia fuscella TaxID=1048955 RepID=A0A9P4P0L4_9PEZI|nr:hypothetical protein EJ08DRAFT_468980 [Tothia fuscella]